MKKFFADFKAFITKGNIVDLAVAVVIGGAFGKIVTSLVNDIIMPLITLIVGGVSVADWKWVIKPEIKDAVTGAVTQAESALRYGNFIQTIIDFLIIAFFIFLALRILMNAQKRLGKWGEEIQAQSTKEIRAFKKELKAQGKTKAEIKAALAARAAEEEAALLAKKAEEEAAKKAEEERAKNESTEALLKQIRDMLAADRGGIVPKAADAEQTDGEKA